MHPRNPYADKRPDFELLATKYPEFKPFVQSGTGYSNIDWKDGDALRALTGILLRDDWDLDVDLPKDRLCPTLPNRLDYIFHLLDLEPYLPTTGRPLRVLDIGTGAVAIYPLLIHRLRPDSVISATEKDLESLDHAKAVLRANGIPSGSLGSGSINLLAPPGDSILFPLLDDKSAEVDVVMCNPPFFASSAEMKEGREMKVEQAHTAHTGSDNEMITIGGEVGFISQMIDESLSIGTRCSWYTSLVGRYSSLPKLVSKLHTSKITNYYILSIRPAKTVRWIITWSFSNIRLPDTLTRPPETTAVTPSTSSSSSFIKLLPPSNTLRHVVRPPRSVSDLKSAILGFLHRIRLYNIPDNHDDNDNQNHYAGQDNGEKADLDDRRNDQVLKESISPSTSRPPSASASASESVPVSARTFAVELVANTNTWSRAARRKLAKRDPGTIPLDPNSNSKPSSNSDSTSNSTSRSNVDNPIPGPGPVLLKSTLRIMDGLVQLDWTYGADRSEFEGLWNSILANSGLVPRGRQTASKAQNKQIDSGPVGKEGSGELELGSGSGLGSGSAGGPKREIPRDDNQDAEQMQVVKKSRIEL